MLCVIFLVLVVPDVQLVDRFLNTFVNINVRCTGK